MNTNLLTTDFSLGKRAKLHRVRSGEYVGWGTKVILGFCPQIPPQIKQNKQEKCQCRNQSIVPHHFSQCFCHTFSHWCHRTTWFSLFLWDSLLTRDSMNVKNTVIFTVGKEFVLSLFECSDVGFPLLKHSLFWSCTHKPKLW